MELLTLLILIGTFFFSVEWNARFAWKILCKWKLSSWNWETARGKQKTEDSLLRGFYIANFISMNLLQVVASDRSSVITEILFEDLLLFWTRIYSSNNWCKILCVILKFVADRHCIKNICILVLTLLQHSLLTEISEDKYGIGVLAIGKVPFHKQNQTRTDAFTVRTFLYIPTFLSASLFYCCQEQSLQLAFQILSLKKKGSERSSFAQHGALFTKSGKVQ